jgi:glycerol-3-phosphate acyltransferase PlsY
MELFLAYGLTAVIGYLLGSINFAVIITKITKNQDIRDMGSGNAGATNVLRCVGVWPAVATLLGDFGKGMYAVFLGRAIFRAFGVGAVSGEYAYLIGASMAGLFALLGHLFPLYFNFRGGKGVLTCAGIMLIVSPVCFAVCFATFGISLLISKTVSLSSCITAIVYPIATAAYTFGYQYVRYENVPINYCVLQTLVALSFSALVIFMHRGNIQRLIDGTEPKISVKKKEAEQI